MDEQIQELIEEAIAAGGRADWVLDDAEDLGATELDVRRVAASMGLRF